MSYIDPDIESLLEADGWIVECQSPLEVSHEETGSFASGFAASYIIDYYEMYLKHKALRAQIKELLNE